ncbi:TetR family transcriptional regulator C-terminal domain-containing protein [Pararoseomonas sp. SCSIO 73927]|uniref:TetR/AcrR family transcriptional regulator n=1 Tax=Pararoseomonas sp. SCSIO 73927 TaxID=3114537 RepID=UPI0030CED287
MGKDTQRGRLVATAAEVFHARGYAATGVREVAGEAGVPHGSLTNHFRSKEALGLAALDHYAERLEATMAATLANPDLAPRERLEAYFDRIEALLDDGGFRRGCLVVDLAAEIPPHSEAIRIRLAEVMSRQSGAFEEVLAAMLAGRDGGRAGDLGAFLMAAWQGTMLRVKVERSAQPLRRFRRVLAREYPPRAAGA